LPPPGAENRAIVVPSFSALTVFRGLSSSKQQRRVHCRDWKDDHNIVVYVGRQAEKAGAFLIGLV
jgi:hypothetical protein